MLLAGIQANLGLDPRLKRSGVTPLRFAGLCSDIRQLAARQSIVGSVPSRLRGEEKIDNLQSNRVKSLLSTILFWRHDFYEMM
jgi:hypothetical protein